MLRWHTRNAFPAPTHHLMETTIELSALSRMNPKRAEWLSWGVMKPKPAHSHLSDYAK